MSKEGINGDRSGLSPVALGWLSSIGVTTLLMTGLTVAYLRTPGTDGCPEMSWRTVTECPWWNEFVYNAMLVGSIGIVVLVPLLVLFMLGRELYQ